MPFPTPDAMPGRDHLPLSKKEGKGGNKDSAHNRGDMKEDFPGAHGEFSPERTPITPAIEALLPRYRQLLDKDDKEPLSASEKAELKTIEETLKSQDK